MVRVVCVKGVNGMSYSFVGTIPPLVRRFVHDPASISVWCQVRCRRMMDYAHLHAESCDENGRKHYRITAEEGTVEICKSGAVLSSIVGKEYLYIVAASCDCRLVSDFASLETSQSKTYCHYKSF